MRYSKFKAGTNTIVYLSKFGVEPSPESRGDLKSGEHFHIISYKSHIIKWLEACIKESAEIPILRETIKQYLILIKKITLSMEDKEKDEINNLIGKYLIEADYIQNNVGAFKKKLGEDVRQNVVKLCRERFENEFEVASGNDTESRYSQVWVKFKAHSKSNLYFGLESFSYLLNDKIYIGILNEGGHTTAYKYDESENDPGTNWWPNYRYISSFRGYDVSFNSIETLKKLHSDPEFRNGFETYLVDEFEIFIGLYKKSLLDFLNRA